MSDKQPEAQGYGIWDMNIDGQRIMGFTPKQWFDREEQHQSAIERKDALLHRLISALVSDRHDVDDWPPESCEVVYAIKQELSQ